MTLIYKCLLKYVIKTVTDLKLVKTCCFYSQLRELGFTQIDALDGSEGMLEVARQKNLYQKYICAFFEGRIEAIETSKYSYS